MKIKFLGSLCLAALLSVSTWAHAKTLEVGEFSVANETSYLLSFSVNKVCSADIGDISAYSIKSIDLPIILKLCATSNTCEIVAHDAERCTGNPVGTINLNFIQRSMEILNPKNPHNITLGGSIGFYEYNIFFNQMGR
jgi:hypothetical protein